MIIGFDGSRAFVKDRTGTENYSYQLLKALAEIDRRNQYIVYLRSSTLPSLPLRGWPDNFQFKTITLPRFWTQAGLAKQTFQDHLDVLFVPAHTLPLIRKPKLKTMVTVHDLGVEYLPKHHQLKQLLYLKWISKFQLNNATKLAAVSKATKEDLVKKIKCDPKRIEVVYEGYDEKLFRPVKGDKLVSTLKHYDLEAGKYFLFVGTIQPRKNLEKLIKAYTTVILGSVNDSRIDSGQVPINRDPDQVGARMTGNVKLVIVGSKGWLSENIYKLPKKLGIEDKVKFLGHVADQDLPALYSGAIGLTFPSLFEGFGLPILEAQACGCPVITSNISSMPEVAGKGAIFVNPYSVDDIVRGMERIKNQELRVKLIKAGLENIKRFSWEKCAKETLEVLENIVNLNIKDQISK